MAHILSLDRRHPGFVGTEQAGLGLLTAIDFRIILQHILVRVCRFPCVCESVCVCVCVCVLLGRKFPKWTNSHSCFNVHVCSWENILLSSSNPTNIICPRRRCLDITMVWTCGIVPNLWHCVLPACVSQFSIAFHISSKTHLG